MLEGVARHLGVERPPIVVGEDEVHDAVAEGRRAQELA